MLVEKFTINVGESTAMYIEMHSEDTPDTELKYGDCKFDEDQKMLIWYGLPDSSEMSGWVKSPWNAANYTGAILNIAANSKNNPADIIWRVMNNDINFDESTYVTQNTNIIEHKDDNNG